MGWSVLLAAVIGISFGCCFAFTRRGGLLGRIARVYAIGSMIGVLATPMILHATAWEATAGKFGWLTFSQSAARTYSGFAGVYSGMVATAWVHGLVGAAIVVLAIWYGTRRIDPGIVDQSRLDGGPIWAWFRVQLPLARTWLVAGLFATAMLAATEMTVANLYGVRTLADEFYLIHATEPSIASVMSVLVLPAAIAIAFLVVTLSWRAKRIESRAIEPAPFDSRPIGIRGSLWGRLASLVTLAYASLMFVFPFFGLVLKTGWRVIPATEPGQRVSVVWSLEQMVQVLGSAPAEFSQEYQWTLLLALGVVALCVPLAWGLASVGRSRSSVSRFLDVVAVLMLLVPGPIVGLAVVRVFSLPVPTFATIYQATLIPTILALSVRGFPVAYWIMRAAYHGVDTSVLDTARLDLGWWQRLWRIDLVLLRRPLLLAGVGAAMVASGDVPVTLPVVPPGVSTVGTRLFSLLHSGARYQESALAFWYVITLVIVGLTLGIGWKSRPR
jgi:iron(III) transport system permease protein